MHLIIDILRHIETPLRWVHFGDGRLMPELKTRVKELPDNINYELRGYVPNQGVLEFYQKNEVDLFVNVSESEGIPVSIMEAISFGIPILATDVGGVHEIVTDKTGVLVDKTFKPKAVADKLLDFVQQSRNVEFRKGIRLFWQQNYSAEQNYTRFTQLVSEG